MRPVLIAPLATVLASVALPGAAWARQTQVPDGPLEARVWLDRGVDPVLERGDLARVYYRASNDAYLLLFHIDTDGALKLLFPGGAAETSQALGGRDYRLLFTDSDQWSVDESPGIGYFFVLASEEPFAFERLAEIPIAGGWSSAPGDNRIRRDPYVVVDEFRRALLPGSEERTYAIDFTAYHVGQTYSYPRFLCYSCHVEEPFEEWNPYLQTCLDVRVVIYNDPYYYPATRYRGDRVVYPRPPEPGLPQFAFQQRFVGQAGTPVVQSRIVSGSGDRPGARMDLPSGADLMRSVDQRGGAGVGSGQGSPGNSLLPSNPALSPSSPGARPPSVRNPISDRPILRRRGGNDSRRPAPR